MDNSREMVLAAFREVAEREFAFATVEAGEAHEFSPRFCAEMEKLMARQSRSPRRRLSGRRCRVVLIAALLAALFLATCSASVRSFVGDMLWGTTREGLTDFDVKVNSKLTFEKMYGFTWVPRGMVLTKKEQVDEYRINTYYRSNDDRSLQLTQAVVVAMSGGLDYVYGESEPQVINGNQVFIYITSDRLYAKWIHDGYYFNLLGTGTFTQEEAERMVASLAPIDGG